jgi:hypothetical protein
MWIKVKSILVKRIKVSQKKIGQINSPLQHARPKIGAFMQDIYAFSPYNLLHQNSRAQMKQIFELREREIEVRTLILHSIWPPIISS